MKYNPQIIENKWQAYWKKIEANKAEDFSKKPKQYILIEFPYPSGQGLHVGHVRSYTALDTVARHKRMAGFNVLYPIGWDAFGLPSENYAIKTGIHPTVSTQENINHYREQLKRLGLSFAWDREVNTTDPKYYRWTQWIFLKLFEKGLAYQDEIPINWCPSCKIGLANEEVVAGNCERCGTVVGKKTLKQWMIKITKYADRLIEDLADLDFAPKIKAQQINWIGRSYGLEVDFKVAECGEVIKVFTTRADTIFGVTAIVLAPEHPLVDKLVTSEYQEEVKKYIAQAKQKSDFERENLAKEKTGVFTGAYALNPMDNNPVPIWIGDYVIATYGGGAVMVVPAHDQRDYAFAKRIGLEIKEVVQGDKLVKGIWVAYGKLVNSGEFSGLTSAEAIEKISLWLEKQGSGRKIVQYKLRDWVFSRQHYWGEPIPIIHCPKCGPVAVPEEDLPVELPFVEKYEPTDTGKSPLAKMEDWLKVKCPKCGTWGERETDTMPNWAGSNWYFMRYVDPLNNKVLADSAKLNYWLPVDWYNGGFEHTTLHLLYSRFVFKFLWDIGVVPKEVGAEPYRRRTSHGIVLAEDGRKMSKSFGNVVNPDDIVKVYGADTLRLYELFMGPFEQAIAWNTQGIKGCYKFLEKVWQLVLASEEVAESSYAVVNALHLLNKKIQEDLNQIKFNTIISSFMSFVNLCAKEKLAKPEAEYFLTLLAPFVPHIAEELWSRLGHKNSIFSEQWPEVNKKFLEKELITLVVQVNGKVRDQLEVKAGLSEAEVKAIALEQEKVKKWLVDKEIKKIIFVPNRLINLVI